MLKRLKPLPTLIIRNPERGGAIVPPEGIDVDEDHPFWRRRLLEGSMIAEDVAPTPTPAPTPTED